MLNFTRGAIRAAGQAFRFQGERLTLAGAHTWDTVIGFGGRPSGFRRLVGNFHRLWAHIEVPRVTLDGTQPWATGADLPVGPLPWGRRDGEWDLETINPAYLDAVERSVRKAAAAGRVVGVVLFDGAFSRFFGPDEWARHPFNPANNVQGVGPSTVQGIHARGPWNRYQRAYVRALVERLEPYRNVIYEIANEPDRLAVTTGWMQRMVAHVQKLTDKPVGVSYVTRIGGAAELSWMRASGADWFAPSGPNAAGGDLPGPVVYDSDHAHPLRSAPDSIVGPATTRGGYWLMDGLDGRILSNVTTLQPDRDVISGLDLS